MSETKVVIKRQELGWLLFWAKFGLEKAIAGTRDAETIELVKRLSSKHRLQVGKPELGKYLVQP